MTFLWPAALAGLGLIPLLVLLYVWQQRRRRRFAVRYSSLSLVRAALPAQSRMRRYLPMTLLLLALGSLVVGMARPVAVTRVPAGRATVMLVLDVSGSMRQNDILPSRLGAAQQAALQFVDKQKSTNQVGVVAFSSTAQLVQEPTTDAQKLDSAILDLTTGRATAIGEGIVTALDAIDQFNQNAAARPSPTDTADEQYRPDIIVLLTDGVSNAGVDPMEAAKEAANSGVRVYAIGYGTDVGSSRQPGRFGGGFGGYGRNMGIDEQALQSIASTTGGKYYTATSAGELQQVFDSLPTVLITREQRTEMSVMTAALAALLVIGAVLLSQLWHPLP